MTRAFWRESLKLGSNHIERYAGLGAASTIAQHRPNDRSPPDPAVRFGDIPNGI
jgi:hypothetical protein